MGNTANNRAKRAAICKNFSASLQVDDEHKIQKSIQSSEISETSSPRRSSRKRQSPRRLLSQTLVGRARIVESEFDERGGLDQPGRNFVLDDEFKARREDEENGREIFQCYLKPAGWKDSYATDKKLDSVYVFLAGGESVKTAEEGVTMFYNYVDIWRKWKSDAEFRNMFQGGDQWTVVMEGHPREKIFSPQRTGGNYRSSSSVSTYAHRVETAEAMKKPQATAVATPIRQSKRVSPPSISKKLVAKHFKSNRFNDTAFQDDATSDCPSIDSMELAAALGGHEPGTPITSMYKKKPAAYSPTGIEVSANDNRPIDYMDLVAARRVDEQTPKAEAAKLHTTPKGERKRRRPRSRSKNPPTKLMLLTKRSKSKSTHDVMSIQSQAEAALEGKTESPPMASISIQKPAAKNLRISNGKLKRGRPWSSSKNPPAKQVKSKSTDDDVVSFQSRAEAPPPTVKHSIDSAELPGALGDRKPPITMVSPLLSEPSQAEQRRYKKLQNDKIMLQMELENEKLKQELAALRKENGGS
ncbi:MAG: hypothetical protein SGBAC_002979 [Bacillariaceae sp.]